MAIKAEQQGFLDAIAPLAVADMAKSGVLASLTIAQAIHESGWGTSELAHNARNYFGIKGGDKRWNGPVYIKDAGEFVNGQAVTIPGTKWRMYASMAESVADHGAFLQQAHYAAVVGEIDYIKACRAIKAAGYATGPTYDAALINHIETLGLTKYDRAAPAKDAGGNSPLAVYEYTSHGKRNHPRQGRILKITPHHCAGNMAFAGMKREIDRADRQMSCNYMIQTDGKIGLFVDEGDRSWCSNTSDPKYNNEGAKNDHQAITIEVANDGGAPDWHVSDKALAALIDLCVDICKRNGIAKLNFTGDATGNLTQHNYFAATACPGPYLKSKFPHIAEEVNRRLGEAVSEPEPKPTPQKGDKAMLELFIVTAADLELFSHPDVGAFILDPDGKNGTRRLPPGEYVVYESAPLSGIEGVNGVRVKVDGSLYWVAKLPGKYRVDVISLEDAEKEGMLGAAMPADTKAALDRAEDATVSTEAAIVSMGHVLDSLAEVKAALGVRG